MRIAIVSGSQRPGSQSVKVARFLKAYIANNFDLEASIVDLAEWPLPWADGAWDAEASSWPEAWTTVSNLLRGADAIIVITPEWCGMATPAVKNLFLLCGSTDVVRHKPCLIVAISGGAGGAYPIAELRMSAAKNSQICFIPPHVIVRNVARRLNDVNVVEPDDVRLVARLHYAIALLSEYGRALRAVRASAAGQDARFASGM